MYIYIYISLYIYHYIYLIIYIYMYHIIYIYIGTYIYLFCCCDLLGTRMLLGRSKFIKYTFFRLSGGCNQTWVTVSIHCVHIRCRRLEAGGSAAQFAASSAVKNQSRTKTESFVHFKENWGFPAAVPENRGFPAMFIQQYHDRNIPEPMFWRTQVRAAEGSQAPEICNSWTYLSGSG